MEIQDTLTAPNELGTVRRELLRDGVAVQCDHRLLHEGLKLSPNRKPATVGDKDVGAVKVYVDTVEEKGTLDQQEVEIWWRVVQHDGHTRLNPDGIAMNGRRVTAPSGEL